MLEWMDFCFVISLVLNPVTGNKNIIQK